MMEYPFGTRSPFFGKTSCTSVMGFPTPTRLQSSTRSPEVPSFRSTGAPPCRSTAYPGGTNSPRSGRITARATMGVRRHSTSFRSHSSVSRPHTDPLFRHAFRSPTLRVRR